jgi:hypothetical protein
MRSVIPRILQSHWLICALLLFSLSFIKSSLWQALVAGNVETAVEFSIHALIAIDLAALFKCGGDGSL